MQTISELVKAQKAASGLSYDGLAQRAVKKGLNLNRQQLSDLANNTPKGWPKSAEMVQALAVALNVPERTVVLAFAHSFGIDVHETRAPFEVRLPATVSALSPAMQDAILHLIRAALEGATDEHHGEEEQEPRTEARGQEQPQPTPMTRAGVSPAQENIPGDIPAPEPVSAGGLASEDEAVPMPDEWALAADTSPSEGRSRRAAQDEAAEGSQDPSDWEGA